MKHLKLTINGATLPILETEAKSGNKYFTLREPHHKNGMTGIAIPALAETLPTSVQVDGITIPLEHGLTAATSRDEAGVTITIPENERRLRASGSATATFPTIGEERTATVAISLRKDGGWQVKITVNRGTGAASPANAAKRQATTMAALQALMGITA
jgi:hypothetical protein